MSNGFDIGWINCNGRFFILDQYSKNILGFADPSDAGIGAVLSIHLIRMTGNM